MRRALTNFVALLVGVLAVWLLARSALWESQGGAQIAAPGDATIAMPPALGVPTAGQPAAEQPAQAADALALLATPAIAAPPTSAVTGSFVQENAAEQVCALPATQAVTTPAEPSIYRWTDADGVTHFSDAQPPGAAAERYDPDTAARPAYFALNIDYRGRSSVPFFRDELTAQATGIYKILADLLGSARLRQVNLNIVLLADEAAYLQYALASTGRNLASTGGFYSSATNEAVTYLYTERARTTEVSRHEATHVIATGILGIVPLWLNEGLAEYFAGLSVQGQYSQVGVRAHLLQLARATRASGYPGTLRDFLTLDAAGWNSAWLENHYALGWALVYFLMDSNDGHAALAALMQQMADQYCRPLNGVATLAQAYPGGLAALEQQFYAWLDRPGTKTPHIY
jgi:hypothetical protein